MGDIVRSSNYERNTTLNQEDILEKCIRRSYANYGKKDLIQELVERITEEIWGYSDTEYGERKVFDWVMGCGTKKEKAFIDQRLCDEDRPLCIEEYQYEDYLDELPKFKTKLEEAEKKDIELHNILNNLRIELDDL